MKLKKKQQPKKAAANAPRATVARRLKSKSACSPNGRGMSLPQNPAAVSSIRRKPRQSERDEALERFERGESVVDFIDFNAGKFVKIP